MRVNPGHRCPALGKRSVRGDCYLLGSLLPRRGVSLTMGDGGGRDAGAWPAEVSWAGGAGRAGVSAHLLMAGIWGVIERGGRPGARVGLHEQLNVIRPRPSGSSWVIDNPAAFLPGPRHQTGGRRRAGQRGRARGPALLPRDARGSREKTGDVSSCLGVSPLLAGQVQQGRGGRGRDVVAESPPRQGAAPREARPTRPGRAPGIRHDIAGTGEHDWQQRSRRGETGDSGNENTSKTEKY